MAFDPTKPIQTVPFLPYTKGNKARIVCTDFKGECGRTMIVAITDENGYEHVYPLKEDGTTNLDWRIVNIPEPKPIDIHLGGIYRHRSGSICICIDPDENLNENSIGLVLIRCLMCSDSRILGLCKYNITEHIGEIKNMGEYLKGDKNAR